MLERSLIQWVRCIAVFACLCVSPCQNLLSQSLSDSTSPTELVNALEQATVHAIAKAESSVVAISRIAKDRAATNRAAANPLSLEIPLALDRRLHDAEFVPTLFGSGVIVGEDGYILTCAHVLGDPKKYDYVVWLNHRSYSARAISPIQESEVQAVDPYSDLAVLQIDASGLRPMSFGPTASLRKGQFVVALGNPDAIARDGSVSAAFGIIANLNRFAPSSSSVEDASNRESIHEYGTLLQTDIPEGFRVSGGALIDLQGRMIGLTTSLASRNAPYRPAGLAIAADAFFQRSIEQLKQGRLPSYGFLGIQPDDLRLGERRKGGRGVRVSLVLPGLPGDRAGLRQDDIILAVNENQIHNRLELFRELSVPAAGEKVKLVVLRERRGRSSPETLELSAELSKKPLRTRRPSFERSAAKRWRGLAVDYATAIPAEVNRFGISAASSDAKIAVKDILPNTPAWTAGIRPGCGILSANNRPLQTPAEFYEAVNRSDESPPQTVKLEILRPSGKREKVVVEPPQAR